MSEIKLLVTDLLQQLQVFLTKNYICSNKNIYYFVYWMCLKFKNIFIVQVHIKTKVLKKYLRLKIKVVYVNYNILS